MSTHSSAEKSRKRRVVAAGIVAGAPVGAIAEAAGVKKRQVHRIAAEPATKTLVEDMLRPHRKRLQKLANNAINAVERAMKAQKDAKSDHVVQLRAVGRWGQLCQLAQGGKSDAPAEGSGMVTWEEFVILYHQRKETTEP